MWNLLIGPVVSGVTGFFKDKAKLKQAKVDGQIAITKQASANVAEWEKLMAKGAMSSWKDEWVLIMLSFPYLLSFTPWADVAHRGFMEMNLMPEWYTYLFVTVCLASFGIKMTGAVKGMLKK